MLSCSESTTSSSESSSTICDIDSEKKFRYPDEYFPTPRYYEPHAKWPKPPHKTISNDSSRPTSSTSTQLQNCKNRCHPIISNSGSTFDTYQTSSRTILNDNCKTYCSQREINKPSKPPEPTVPIANLHGRFLDGQKPSPCSCAWTIGVSQWDIDGHFGVWRPRKLPTIDDQYLTRFPVPSFYPKNKDDRLLDCDYAAATRLTSSTDIFDKIKTYKKPCKFKKRIIRNVRFSVPNLKQRFKAGEEHLERIQAWIHVARKSDSIVNKLFHILKGSKIPIIWAFGRPIRSIANIRRQYLYKLAALLNFQYIHLDEQIPIWSLIGHEHNPKTEDVSNWNPALKQAIPLSMKITTFGYKINLKETLELLKLAMLQDGFEKKGFIIDGFPLTFEDTVAFEDYFYPVTAGIYFQNEAWSKDKSTLPAVIPPTYFRRNFTYNEAAVEEACGYEGLKAIKVLNAEHLSDVSSKPLTTVIKAFLDFYREIIATEGPPVQESVNFKRFAEKVGDGDELWHYIERVKREKFPREKLESEEKPKRKKSHQDTKGENDDEKKTTEEKGTTGTMHCDDPHWYKQTEWYKRLKQESSDPDFWKWALLRKWGIVSRGAPSENTSSESSIDPLRFDDVTLHPMTKNYQLDPLEKVISEAYSDHQGRYVIPKTGSPVHFDDPYKTVTKKGEVTGNFLKDVVISEVPSGRPSKAGTSKKGIHSGNPSVVNYTPYVPEPDTTLRNMFPDDLAQAVAFGIQDTKALTLQKDLRRVAEIEHEVFQRDYEIPKYRFWKKFKDHEPSENIKKEKDWIPGQSLFGGAKQANKYNDIDESMSLQKIKQERIEAAPVAPKSKQKEKKPSFLKKMANKFLGKEPFDDYKEPDATKLDEMNDDVDAMLEYHDWHKKEVKDY